MIKWNVGKMRWTYSPCSFSTKENFDVIMKEHNKLVDALDIAYKEINRLSYEIERLKEGLQEQRSVPKHDVLFIEELKSDSMNV